MFAAHFIGELFGPTFRAAFKVRIGQEAGRLPLACHSVVFLCCVGKTFWESVLLSGCVCVCYWFFLHIQMRKFCCSWVGDSMSKVHEVCMILISDCMRRRPRHCKANEFQVSLSTSLYRYGVWMQLLWVFVIHTYLHNYMHYCNYMIEMSWVFTAQLSHQQVFLTDLTSMNPNKAPHGSSVDGWHVQPAEHVDPKPGVNKPTVDGSEIPNNHLGCIKPCK